VVNIVDRSSSSSGAESSLISKKVIMSSQKVAVVTGASQGLGAAIVAAYRKLGYGVVATTRTS
jgi:3-oxoacyl-ACP reductase-like protein